MSFSDSGVRKLCRDVLWSYSREVNVELDSDSDLGVNPGELTFEGW